MNYNANEMFGIEEDDLISPNISDHFELISQMKDHFFLLKIYQWNALNGEVIMM
jgi:hypothetical protein